MREGSGIKNDIVYITCSVALSLLIISRASQKPVKTE
jgi:hypothetical protein